MCFIEMTASEPAEMNWCLETIIGDFIKDSPEQCNLALICMPPVGP